MQLLLTWKVKFGAYVVVIVYPDTTGNITIPSVEEGKVERRKASADTVGLLQLLTHTPPALFSVCLAHQRETVKVCDDGKLRRRGFLCCLDLVAKRELGTDVLLVPSQRPDFESTIRATASGCSWRRATTGKMTSCAR